MKIQQEIKKWKNFAILLLALALFFVLPQVHDWANGFLVKLHFCDHTYCIIFAIVFVVMAFFAWKNKKHYLKIGLIILGVGIILMNMAVCDVDGNMSIGNFDISFLGEFAIFESSLEDCKPGVDCPGDIVEVPIPPCVETDDGRDYITFGSILSGANLDDICMGNILRERYCYDELTYTSEDINCKTRYGETWTCEEGECRDVGEIIDDDDDDVDLEACYDECYDEVFDYCVSHSGGEDYDEGGEFVPCMEAFEGDIIACRAVCDGEVIIEENTEELCTDEIDNDLDEAIDCFDTDCIPFCECRHDSEFPSCYGYTDDIDTVCSPMYTSETVGWCVPMPYTETPCHVSEVIDLFCGGWCDEGMHCINDGGCYCSDWACLDTDDGFDIETPGSCIGETGELFDFCTGDVLTEYQCLGECIGFEQDCEILWGGDGICETDKFGVGYCVVGVF